MTQFSCPLLEEPTTPLFPLMRLKNMELKAKIYDCSLVFREFLVLSISLIQSFQQTSDTCTIQGRPKLCGVVFKERVWLKDMVGTSLEARRPNSLPCNESKGFPMWSHSQQALNFDGA